MISAFLPSRLQDLCLVVASVLLWSMSLSARADVLVVLSDETASYQQVAEELRAGLQWGRDDTGKFRVVTVGRIMDADDQVLKGYELVVTVGLSAARAVVAREGALATPPLTLCLLIPRQAFDGLATPHADGRARRLTAVFIDQPLSRQLDLLRVALPGRNRIGAVLGPSSAGLANELRDAAKERELTLNVVEIAESSGVYGALQRVLSASDVLLAEPDPVVFNASTVYGLMLTTYRAQVPVIGFSEGLVKAGALVGLFSTARQLGKQGAEIANRILAGDAALPAPQYPRYFTIRVNQSVARSLGISLKEESAITAALAARTDARRVPPRGSPALEGPMPGRAP